MSTLNTLRHPAPVPTVKHDPARPVPPEILADSIVAISKAMRDLTSRSRLNRDAIVTLIKDRIGLGKNTIHAVLDALEGLEGDYVLPVKQA